MDIQGCANQALAEEGFVGIRRDDPLLECWISLSIQYCPDTTDLAIATKTSGEFSFGWGGDK